MDSMAWLDETSITLDPVSQLVLAGVLVVMMFAVALNLRLADFRFLFVAPKAFLAGALAQLVGLPALTLVLALLIAPSPSVALGMIVVACCPGGNMSNVITWMARGDVALSVSLTALSSFTAALLMPVSILFWTGFHGPASDLVRQLDIDPIPFIAQTFVLLAIPLAAGMALNAAAPRLAARIRPFFGVAALVCLAGVILISTAGNWEIFLRFGWIVLPVAMMHNAAALGLGALTGRLIGATAPMRRSLTIEVGIQNAGLGLVILLTQFQGLGGAAAIIAVWGVWHLISGSALAGLFRLHDRRKN